MDDWTQEDQDRAATERRKIAADYQRAQREGPAWAAWSFDKLANIMLWVERQGKRLLRGF